MLQTCFPYTSKNTTYINDILQWTVEMKRSFSLQQVGLSILIKRMTNLPKRLGQGIICSLDLARPTELAKALGVNQTTVSRNIQEYIKRKGLKVLLIAGPIGILTSSLKTNSKLSNASWTKVPQSLQLRLKLGSAKAVSALPYGTASLKKRSNRPIKPRVL